jgi:hypothetical protein
MAIIFFALAFVLLVVASFLIWSARDKDKKIQNWERADNWESSSR